MSVFIDFDQSVYPFPAKPARLSSDEKSFYRQRIKSLLFEKNAVIVAHYYTDPEIQALAEETGVVSQTLLKWRVLVQSIRHQLWLLLG